MRLTPACGEGWRRLSVVLSVLLAILSFGWFMQQYNTHLARLHDGCEQLVRWQKNHCLISDEGDACYKSAETLFSKCVLDAYPSVVQRLPEWGLRALYSLAVAVVVLYLIQLIGWIAAGFRQSKSA
jgi:uncharacterized protein involved in cysteine biosynthesis